MNDAAVYDKDRKSQKFEQTDYHKCHHAWFGGLDKQHHINKNNLWTFHRLFLNVFNYVNLLISKPIIVSIGVRVRIPVIFTILGSVGTAGNDDVFEIRTII